jgi:hypothetical protein
MHVSKDSTDPSPVALRDFILRRTSLGTWGFFWGDRASERNQWGNLRRAPPALPQKHKDPRVQRFAQTSLTSGRKVRSGVSDVCAKRGRRETGLCWDRGSERNQWGICVAPRRGVAGIPPKTPHPAERVRLTKTEKSQNVSTVTTPCRESLRSNVGWGDCSNRKDLP